jgi:hypothetical protein
MQKRIGTLAAWAAPIALVALAAHGEQEVPGYEGVGVFDLPALSSAEISVVGRAARGDADAAAGELAALIERFPRAAQLHLVRAALALIRGETDAAVAALLEADELGAVGLRAMLRRPEWSALAGDARLAGLEDRAAPEPAPVAPALVEQGRAPVGPANTGWDPSLMRLIAHFRFPPVLGTHAFAEKLAPEDPLAALQQLVARGRAAGNVGDLYDNRDRGHSTLDPGNRVQLARVAYGPEAQAAGIDYGLNTQILFDAPTFGNSSTALTGPLWRSQPRFALTTPGGAMRLWQLYANNHIYVFPEHQDHDPPAEGGHGDLIPANTPYMLISQGSSGSDKPFLRAVQAIFAAFTPEVKARLVEERLVAPTVQQVFRRGLAGVGEDGYLGPRAHPSVFRAEDIDLAAMIRLAQKMQADQIPPVVTLRMLTETPPNPSIFADGTNEILFDTPSAIARVWRAADAERQFEMLAEATDPNGRPLEFRWIVLRGDADRIRIEPLDRTGARADAGRRAAGDHLAAGRHRRLRRQRRRDLGAGLLQHALPRAPGARLFRRRAGARHRLRGRGRHLYRPADLAPEGLDRPLRL